MRNCRIIRGQRWGEERFRKIFKRTVEACLKAKIATAEVVHIDASLIRANVSWESLAERHVEDVLGENQTDEGTEVERKSPQSAHRYRGVRERRRPWRRHSRHRR
jgi:hypothetical protein